MSNGKAAMIVAPQTEAVDAGAEVLRAGGNAVDAAICCALVQGVVDPMMCGLAGFGSMGLYLPQRGHHRYIDFHAPAPRRATSTMWESLVEGEARDGYGFILKGRVNDIGYQSICLPAALKAYHVAHTRFGKMPWAELVAPAIDWAVQGWMVRPHVYKFWADEGEMGRVGTAERIAWCADGRRLYCSPDGSPKRIGERIINPDLAATLLMIAQGGADVFYRGELAQRMIDDIESHGGLLSREDLAGYEPVDAAPVWGEYRGFKIATNNPPGGGAMLLQMLNTLEHFDLRRLGQNTAAYVRVVAEAMKRATIDKDRYIGDPAFVEVPLDKLVSKDYAAQLAQSIERGDRARVPRFNSGMPSNDTTHISVMDGEGNCVTMTHSLGMPSGVITPGLGFMHNGCMGVFDPRPGRAGSIAPGKARFSSLCPSIVFKQGKPFLVIGAPGGTQIAMGVLQAVLNVLDFDMTMTEAVSAPRFSSTSNAIDVSNRVAYSVTRQLEAEGYKVIRSPYPFGFAGVHAIRVTEDGRLDGGADPDRDGVAMYVAL